MEMNDKIEMMEELVEEGAEIINDTKSVPVKLIVGVGVASVALIGGGVAIAKKYGKKAESKIMDIQEARVEKKKEKLEAKARKIQDKKNYVEVEIVNEDD